MPGDPTSSETCDNNKKQVFHVTHFKAASFVGSYGGFLKQPRTKGRSYSGTSCFTGGLLLKTPFSNLIKIGCWPTGKLFKGTKTEDSMESTISNCFIFESYRKQESQNMGTDSERSCIGIDLLLENFRNLHLLSLCVPCLQEAAGNFIVFSEKSFAMNCLSIKTVHLTEETVVFWC